MCASQRDPPGELGWVSVAARFGHGCESGPGTVWSGYHTLLQDEAVLPSTGSMTIAPSLASVCRGDAPVFQAGRRGSVSTTLRRNAVRTACVILILLLSSGCIPPGVYHDLSGCEDLTHPDPTRQRDALRSIGTQRTFWFDVDTEPTSDQRAHCLPAAARHFSSSDPDVRRLARRAVIALINSMGPLAPDVVVPYVVQDLRRLCDDWDAEAVVGDKTRWNDVNDSLFILLMYGSHSRPAHDVLHMIKTDPALERRARDGARTPDEMYVDRQDLYAWALIEDASEVLKAISAGPDS